MEPRQVKTAADARRIVKERGLTHVKVGVHDIDGILRGKYIHIDKFHSALEGGFADGQPGVKPEEGRRSRLKPVFPSLKP